jgi:hypothetical protein
MRVSFLLVALMFAAEVAVTQQQDTNFPVGPQYLITTPSPYFLQPIATPSLSPDQQFGITSPETGEAGPITIPVPVNLPFIYWGWTVPAMVEVVPEAVPVPTPSELPADFVNVGVTAMATPGWMRDRDYGMSLAQAARYWKAHAAHARRTYTNDDIERMRGE